MRLEGVLLQVRQTKTGKYLLFLSDKDAPDRVVRVISSENSFKEGDTYRLVLRHVDANLFALLDRK